MAATAFGEWMMPARSANWASSGENACFISMRTVFASLTSTAWIAAISDFRRLSGRVRARSSENFTAAASTFSPSWNSASSRSVSVMTRPPSEATQLVASIGTMLALVSMSTSLSQSACITRRPTKVQFLAPSRTSGSSCSPMRSCWAEAGSANGVAMSAASASEAAKRFMGDPPGRLKAEA